MNAVTGLTGVGIDRLKDDQDFNEEHFGRIDPHVFRRFYGFVRQYRSALVASLVSTLLFTLAQVGLPMAIRAGIDSAIGRSSIPLGWALSAFAVLAVLTCGFNYFQESVTARLAQRVIFDLRRAMFAHLQDVSLSFLDNTHIGRLMSRLQGDVNALQEFLEQSVTAVGDLFLLIGIVGALLALNWKLGLFTFLLLPVLAGIRVAWLPWAQRRFRRARDASSAVNAALAENINGIRTVQESRREALNLDRFEARAMENFRAQAASAVAGQMMVPAVDILTGIALALVVLVGGNAVISGGLDVGVMVAYVFYVQRLFDPIRTLSLQYTVLQRAVTAGHRIFEVMDIPVAITDQPHAPPIDAREASISFRNVTFGYRPGLPILHEVNFEIAANQTVALVGATGSGKTSIAALVHRFYDVWDGEIRIAGQDVRSVTLDSLGQSIAMVLQEPFLFTASVAENIRYRVRNASMEDVVAAAKAVNAHDFIVRLPRGYDTVLGQRGRNLSVGQRQLLSFARALLADPRILILDEATANIDSLTEQAIQGALRVLSRGRTTIIIAHRLATVRDADKIIVLRLGRIVEQGNHDALVQAKGLYAAMLAGAH